MTAKQLEMLRAKFPASISEQAALERRVFENRKSAESAARDYFARFPINEHGLQLIHRLAGRLFAKSIYFTRHNVFVRGTTFYAEVAA